MPRLCSFSRLSLAVLLVAVVGSVAWAKPKVAILGLEAAASGVSDPKDAQVAARLTEELRRIPRGGVGKFDFAANSNRELQDEKLMGNCDTERPECMAPIGNGLGADFLVFGRIERVVEKGKDGYSVSIKILNVKAKKLETDKPTVTFVPMGSFTGSGGALEEWAQKTYARVTGEKATVAVPDRGGPGKLVVKSNVKEGTVLVGGAKKGVLEDGSITLSLSDGQHELAIEAPGHRRYEATITVTSGKTRTVNAELEEILEPPPPPPPPGDNTGMWRGVMWTSVATGVLSGAVLIYGWRKIGDINAELCSGNRNGCETSSLSDVARVEELNGQAGRWSTTTKVMGGIVGISVGGVILGAWRGYFSKTGEEKREAGVVGKRKRREFTVTPVIAPGGGGATLRFDW